MSYQFLFAERLVYFVWCGRHASRRGYPDEIFVVRHLLPNKLAGVGAGRTPEFIEMMQVGASRGSGSVRLAGRYAARAHVITDLFCRM